MCKILVPQSVQVHLLAKKCISWLGCQRIFPSIKIVVVLILTSLSQGLLDKLILEQCSNITTTNLDSANDATTAPYKCNIQVSARVLVHEDSPLEVLKITLVVKKSHITLLIEGQGNV